MQECLVAPAIHPTTRVDHTTASSSCRRKTKNNPSARAPSNFENCSTVSVLTFRVDLAPFLEHGHEGRDHCVVQLDVGFGRGVAKVVDQRGLLVEVAHLHITRPFNRENAYIRAFHLCVNSYTNA